MSSLLDVRQGAQRPSLLYRPPGTFQSDGLEVVELAASAGLILDDWQAWVLIQALAYMENGDWAAFEVCLLVARQNGKGSILEALELAALFLFKLRLTVHSAHEFKTCREHFFRMRNLIEASDELAEQVDTIYTANGAESIRLKDGCRLNFVARSRGSGRGFSGDLIVMDEAFKLPEEAVGAMLPALSARPNPQIWYTSSAPHADSYVLHGLRNRAIAGNAGRLFLAEWGNEPGADPEDEEALARANPGMNIRIPREHMAAEYQAMRHLGDEFARERLGIPSTEDRTAGVFGPGLWAACADDQSRIDSPVSLALDVAPNMQFASFAAAGHRHDGLPHVELVERRPGTGWVVRRAQELVRKWGGAVVVDPRGPAGGLIEALTAEKVDVKQVPDGDFARACATLQKEVLDGTIRHLGQRPLDDAVAGAQIRPSGDAWRWSRTSSQVDISPLVAVTLAFWASHGAGPSLFAAWA